MIQTIDEVILFCEQVAKLKEYRADLEEEIAYARLEAPTNDIRPMAEIEKLNRNAERYRQLAEWLKELKDYKDRQDLINKSWQELINYKEGIEKIKMRSQSYRERGETILASGMEQALDILEEVNADERR